MLDPMPPLDPDVRRAYLARLGVDPEPPSAAALQHLVRGHAERVPYETLWIAAGEGWGIDPVESAARIALNGRGGYCYHVNGALGMLLGSLGYAVRAHAGGVHGPDGPGPESRGNHLVLTVQTPADDTTWYVDVGLGDAFHEPVPLVEGPIRQPPFDLSLERTAGGWHLTHDPAGGFTGMAWTDGPAQRTDFEERHRWLSSAQESGFVRVPMAERRDATGVDVVRGLVLSRIGEGATSEPVTDRAAWFGVLAELFDLRFEGADPALLDRLWESVVSAHRRWEAEEAEKAASPDRP